MKNRILFRGTALAVVRIPVFRWIVALVLAGRAVSTLAQEAPPELPPTGPAEFRLVVPDDITVAACAEDGVVVTFPTPRVVTDCEDPGEVVCVPSSGSVFPFGQTVVACSVATGCREAATNAFVVTVVRDVEPPTIDCPTNLLVYATAADGVRVDYPWPAVMDDADSSPTLVCTPPPGSLFPIGTTQVACVAMDACGHVASCSFQVEVRRPMMTIRRTINEATGMPQAQVDAVGYEGLDVATDLGGDWTPLTTSAVSESLAVATNKFYRPPVVGGVLRAPKATGEIAYVSVGLLDAYADPGINPARQSGDDTTTGGTTLLAGDTGGSGNLWSGPKGLPFTFYFYGRPYTQFRVSKNGLLTFSTNLLSNTQGLSYFNFNQSQTTNSLVDTLPLWSKGFAVDNTIFCMAGRYASQTASDTVRGYLHGVAPHRQVWIIYRHSKDTYGQTTTAIVLEESSNRILLMDMDADNPGASTDRLVAGIQGTTSSLREVCQVPASPYMRLVGKSPSIADNGCYLFRPYRLGHAVSGQASPQLMAATNLDLFITEQARMLNAPGMTVAISRNGRLIFNKAYGYANVQKNEPMKPFHRACIGSVSKMFAAFGLEILINKGTLSGLGEWPYAPDRLGKTWFWDGVNTGIANNIHSNFTTAVFLNTLTNITLKHLLSHSAALGTANDDLGAAGAYANGDYTKLKAEDQVRWFMATRTLLTNGVAKLRKYSNPSFKQLGVLIEQVTGQPYEAWVQANILSPSDVPFARLMRTFENEETWRDARRYLYYVPGKSTANPSVLFANSPWGTSRIDGHFGPTVYGDAIYANAADGAAGSWTMTAADLVRVMAALDGMSNRMDILPATRFNELENVAYPSISSKGGIGWDSVDTGNAFVWKNGNIGYGCAHLMRSTAPDRLTVAVVANTDCGVTPFAVSLFNIVNALPSVSPFYDLFPAQLAEQSP